MPTKREVTIKRDNMLKEALEKLDKILALLEKKVKK